MSSLSPGKFIAARDIPALLYAYPLRKLAEILHPDVIRLISTPLVKAYSRILVSRQRRAAIRKKMSRIFQNVISKEELDELSRECIRNSAYSFVDDLIVDRLDRQKLMSRGIIEGIENVKSALSEKKGVILVGGHFSGNRIANLYMRESGIPVMCVRMRHVPPPQATFVARKYCAPRVTRLLHKSFEDYVYIDDAGFALDIMRRLRENGLVRVLIDTKALSGVRCSFFGHYRPFHSKFLEIARLTGAAVIPQLCIGNSSSFRIFFGRRLELQPAKDRNEFLATNLQAVVEILEAQISSFPEHWVAK